MIDLPLIELFNKSPQFQKIGVQKYYNASMLRKDLNRQQELMQPVWFSHLSEPVSIFKLRELLLQYNVIGKEYGPIENEFVFELRNILPSEFKVKMFKRDPSQQLPKPIYNVVCTTEDLMKWSQLTTLIKNPMFASVNLQNKCLKLTQEVIIMDIGTHVEKQLFLLNVIEQAIKQDFFAKALSENLIPSGPTRGDPKSIIMAKSEESISQILLHNPGLTREEIDYDYKLVEGLSNPVANSNAKIDSSVSSNVEARLNTITSSFFKNKPPANWKVYPPERLKGKYIGHQVRFFNIPTEHSAQVETFFKMLKQNDFEAELARSGEKLSIVVDLNTSKKM